MIPIVRLVVEDFARKPENAKRLRLDISDVGDGNTLLRSIDVDAFGIILRNLIENALVHGTPDSPANIVVRKDGTISVSNAGPVVPPAQLRELTKRFKRGNSAAWARDSGSPSPTCLCAKWGVRLSSHRLPAAAKTGSKRPCNFP